MSYTQADLDFLKQMLANGVTEESHGDKKVKFATFDDLKARIAVVTRALESASTERPRVGVIRFREVR